MIAEGGVFQCVVGGKGLSETYGGQRDELKGLRTIMERRKDHYGKKEGGDELYGVGRTVGVKLRKWEKYMSQLLE